jgi:hypothetical protein
VATGLIVGLAVAAVALLLICGGLAVGGYLLYADAKDTTSAAPDDSTMVAPDDTTIDGLVDYRQTNPALLTRNHQDGRIEYTVSPPAGGDHNGRWQNCEGDVYEAEIAPEHAVHSLEHGAVWIAYRPDLPSDQVEELADKVQGRAYMLMSPYPGLDRPISLQAWGYQLKVDDADDADIDKFIKAYSQIATTEPGATCGGGVATTGRDPVK